MAEVHTGAARIALGARHSGVTGIRIVPIGLHYENKAGFRSRALVNVGEPIDLDAWADSRPDDVADGADDRGAVGDLTTLVDARLRRAAPDFPDWPTADALETDRRGPAQRRRPRAGSRDAVRGPGPAGRPAQPPARASAQRAHHRWRPSTSRPSPGPGPPTARSRRRRSPARPLVAVAGQRGPRPAAPALRADGPPRRGPPPARRLHREPPAHRARGAGDHRAGRRPPRLPRRVGAVQLAVPAGWRLGVRPPRRRAVPVHGRRHVLRASSASRCCGAGGVAAVARSRPPSPQLQALRTRVVRDGVGGSCELRRDRLAIVVWIPLLVVWVVVVVDVIRRRDLRTARQGPVDRGLHAAVARADRLPAAAPDPRTPRGPGGPRRPARPPRECRTAARGGRDRRRRDGAGSFASYGPR